MIWPGWTLLIIAFITGITAQGANPPVILAKDHLPYEFKILTSATNKYLTSLDEHYQLVEDLKQIDASLAVMKKEEQFFLIKAEIYKEILRSKPNIVLNNRFVDPKTLNELDAKVKEYSDNPYLSWLIAMIRDDLRPLLSSSLRNTYLFQLNSRGPITDPELQKYERKLKILLPWAILFLQQSEDELNVTCKKLVKRSLASIKLALVEFNKINKTQTPALAENVYKLSNFRVRTQEEIAGQTGALENELLSTDFNQKQQVQNDEAWKPREEGIPAIDQATLPELFPTPDPNYTPPAELPTAQTDWDTEYLFPDPDPKYQAPEELPQAKNDWQKEYLYPTPDPNYIPPTTMPIPVQSWESVRP